MCHTEKKSVQKHFPESEEIERGRIRERPAGLRSTKVKVSAERDRVYENNSGDEDEDDDDPEVQTEARNKKTCSCYSLTSRMN